MFMCDVALFRHSKAARPGQAGMPKAADLIAVMMAAEMIHGVMSKR